LTPESLPFPAAFERHKCPDGKVWNCFTESCTDQLLIDADEDCERGNR